MPDVGMDVRIRIYYSLLFLKSAQKEKKQINYW
jgi:hypothetical protein